MHINISQGGFEYKENPCGRTYVPVRTGLWFGFIEAEPASKTNRNRTKTEQEPASKT